MCYIQTRINSKVITAQSRNVELTACYVIIQYWRRLSVRKVSDLFAKTWWQRRNVVGLLFGAWLPLWCVLVVYNENPTRALSTTSLKCCLPWTEAIDRREKNSCMLMKVQGIEIHQVSAKRKIRWDTFLTDLHRSTSLNSIFIRRCLVSCAPLSASWPVLQEYQALIMVHSQFYRTTKHW